eukprot:SAG31_NODE_675_length_12908_cov_11.596612_12_plen_288_part_00
MHSSLLAAATCDQPIGASWSEGVRPRALRPPWGAPLALRGWRRSIACGIPHWRTEHFLRRAVVPHVVIVAHALITTSIRVVRAVPPCVAARYTTASCTRYLGFALRAHVVQVAGAVGGLQATDLRLEAAASMGAARLSIAWICCYLRLAGGPVPPCRAFALETTENIHAGAVAVARVRQAVVLRLILLAVRTAVVRCALATVAAEKIGAGPSVQAGLPTARGGRLLLAVRLRLPTALRRLVQRLAVIASVARRALALRLHLSKNTVGPAGSSMLARVRKTHLCVPIA